MSSHLRAITSQCAIVLAVCVGGWMMLIQPRSRELGELQQAITLGETVQSGGNQSPESRIREQSTAVRSWLESMQVCNRAAADTARIYSLINAAADERGIRLHSIVPEPSPRSDNQSIIRPTRVTIVAEGGYDQIAEFLGALSALEGHIRPISLTIGPLDDGAGRQVMTKCACEWLEVRMPEALAPFSASREKGEPHVES